MARPPLSGSSAQTAAGAKNPTDDEEDTFGRLGRWSVGLALGLAAMCVCVRRELRADAPRPTRARAALHTGESKSSQRRRGTAGQGKHQRLASQEEVTQVELEEELASVKQHEQGAMEAISERPPSPAAPPPPVQEACEDV